jgi:Protein of unknown function (DUF3460)
MGYESEATQFLRSLLDSHPELKAQRARNRATWWDKPQDLETQKDREEARVATTGYVYFPRPRGPGS